MQQQQQCVREREAPPIFSMMDTVYGYYHLIFPTSLAEMNNALIFPCASPTCNASACESLLCCLCVAVIIKASGTSWQEGGMIRETNSIVQSIMHRPAHVWIPASISPYFVPRTTLIVRETWKKAYISINSN